MTAQRQPSALSSMMSVYSWPTTNTVLCPKQLEFMVQNQGKKIWLGPLAITSFIPNAEFSFLSLQSYILPELCPGSQILSWHWILDWINSQWEESLKWMANQFWFLWGPTVAAENEGREAYLWYLRSSSEQFLMLQCPEIMFRGLLKKLWHDKGESTKSWEHWAMKFWVSTQGQQHLLAPELWEDKGYPASVVKEADD